MFIRNLSTSLYCVIKRRGAYYFRGRATIPLYYRQLLKLKHVQLTRQFVRRNRVFFSWFFNLVSHSSLPRSSLNDNTGHWFGERLVVQGLRRQNASRAWQRVLRTSRKVGPKLNLRINALVVRLCRHGRRGRARRMLEEVFRIIGEHSKVGSPSNILNSVLLSLEPPFEIKIFRRRWGASYYPAPLWSHRKYFLSVKILAKGALYYQRLNRCPFVVALAHEVLAVFNNQQDCFSRKLFRKLIRIGMRHKSSWRRFVQNL